MKNWLVFVSMLICFILGFYLLNQFFKKEVEFDNKYKEDIIKNAELVYSRNIFVSFKNKEYEFEVVKNKETGKEYIATPTTYGYVSLCPLQ